MKIKKSELLAALTAVDPGTAAKATVEQSTTFVFNDGRIYTYNDEISISAPLEVGFNGSVPAKKFLALVKKLSGADVTLTIDKGELMVSGGPKQNAGLRIEDEIKLPLDELGSPKDWNELPAKFTEAVQFCLFSAGKDQSNYLLTMIHVAGEVVESSDSYRATRYEMGEDLGATFLIPASSARYLVNYNPSEYAQTPGWLHFRNEGDIIFSCRWPEGEEFPDISGFIETQGEKIELPEGLSSIMERGATLSEGERLTLILEDGGNLVLATESEDGWFEEETTVAYKGKAMEFDIYPDFLGKILKVKADVFVSAKIMKFEADSFVHVVALLSPKKRK